ncbi:MAG: S24/S26 family peptidase [Terriglobales bacterium]
MPLQSEEFVASPMAVMSEARDDHKLDLAAEVLRAGGSIRLQALGNSMLPSIWPGDVLCIESRSEKIVPGDVVLVAREGRFFIHRLIEKRESGWITRGDSLPQNDEAVAEAQVLGKVVHRNNGILVSGSQLSRLNRALAWAFCRWDLFRNVALRMYLLRDRRAYQ